MHRVALPGERHEAGSPCSVMQQSRPARTGHDIAATPNNERGHTQFGDAFFNAVSHHVPRLLQEVPGPAAEVRHERESVQPWRLPHSIGHQGAELRTHRSVFAIHHRPDQHDRTRKVRSQARDLRDPLGAHRVTDQYELGGAELLQNLAERTRHFIHIRRRRGLRSGSEPRKVDRVGIRGSSELAMQPGEVVMRSADPVYEHVARSAG